MKFPFAFILCVFATVDIQFAFPCLTSFGGSNETQGFASVVESATGSTFKIWNVTARPHFAWNFAIAAFTEQVKELPQYYENQYGDIVHMPNYPGKILVSHNGFVETIIHAYRSHHKLVLRPDDVWAAIMTQFSFYVNGNPGKVLPRNSSTEKISLTVKRGHGNDSYSRSLKHMVALINRNLGDGKLKDWMLPNFSTTNDDDIVTVAAMLMASSKRYFSYEFPMSCGIPEITLEGTSDDWKKILQKLEKLKDYKLEWWHTMLKPVAQQFLNVTKGIVDVSFWKRMIHYERGGAYPSYVSGWITAFCVFDENGDRIDSDMTPSRFKDGRWDESFQDWLRLDISTLPSAIVEVVTKTDNFQSNGIIAGHLATEITNNGISVQPKLGWFVAKKNV